ncbi:MAG: energy transducer TonB [Gammaproteobacteria bacterium]|nr:energy transducer TonB [Gammaproteobacteria bacterium]
MNGHDILTALPAAPDRLARRLIRHAARSTPPALAQRLEEEWLADLAARSAALSQLRLALGCWWAASVITHEFGAVSLAVAPGSGGTVSSWTRSTRGLSRRTAALILISCLHLTLVYFLAVGLTQHGAEVAPPPFQVEGFQTDPQRHEPPPLPPPTLRHLEKFDPVPPVVIVDDPRDTGVTGDVRVDPSSHEEKVAPPQVDRVIGGPGKGFPDTTDYYPEASRRLGETGVAAVQVCVDERGRLASDPALAESSGIRRLDAAALTLAKAGSGHYRASTENGRPVSSCFPFRIRFRMIGDAR